MVVMQDLCYVGSLWKLKKCLYGLNDGARNFFLSVKQNLLNFKCVHSKLDPAIFYFKKDNDIQGIICCHVDDFLHAGTNDFEQSVMDKLRSRFTPGKIEQNRFRYIGFDIKMIDAANGIVMNQNKYIQDIEPGTMNTQRMLQKQDTLSAPEQTILRQLVGKMNWVAYGSRPDVVFETIDLSTKLKCGTVSDLLRAIKVIRCIKQTESNVTFPRLMEIEAWKLLLYTDASYANICDGTSSVGAYIVFLTDGQHSCPLDWHAHKLKRVVRSTLAAETLSLQEGYDATYYLRCLVEELCGVELPITAYVDNKSVVESIHSTSLVDDKRLRIDIAALKENIGKNFEVKWCPGDYMIADSMTKRGASSLKLMNILQSGTCCERF